MSSNEQNVSVDVVSMDVVSMDVVSVDVIDVVYAEVIDVVHADGVHADGVHADGIDADQVDPLTEQFNGILNSLTAFKAQITVIQQQLRGIEKTVCKEMKGLRKTASKHKNKGNRKPSGFAKPTAVSDELCLFMNKEIGSEVARTEVTQYIIKYISTHNLQNPENRRIIHPDECLKVLLNIKEGDEVTYFNLQRFMNTHFHKKPLIAV
jgi:hypothetical protein